MSSNCARSLLRQPAGHRLVDEVDHLRLERRLAERRRRMAHLALNQAEATGHVVCQALRAVTHAHHDLARERDRIRVHRIEEQHRHRGARTEFLLAVLAQQIAHRDRHVAEIDVHRTRVQAFVADGAMIRDVGEFLEVPDRDAAARLLLVQKRFDQQTAGEDLVARAVQQIGARHMRAADRLALSATQTVLDRIGDRADLALLEDQTLLFEQTEARRIGLPQIGTGQQLAAIEAAFRIDLALIRDEAVELRRARDSRAW